MKAGKPEKAHIEPRYVQLIMQTTIKDIYDALVELITNCDDSYHRLYENGKRSDDGGPILIEIEHRRSKASLLVIRDKAEGMDITDMREKIKKIGKKFSGEEDRGFMGRGAKECAVLGKAIFESIKDNKHHRCEFHSNLDFIPFKPVTASPQIRKRLGIKRGNGTSVTIEITQKKRYPKYENIKRDLPWHFALRDVFSSQSKSKVYILNLNDKNAKPEKKILPPPIGKCLKSFEYQVPGYPNAKARLEIRKSEESFIDPQDRFRRSGFIVKASRAIHECSLFYPEFEKEPLAKKYFGRIECPYIDILCQEYDKIREKNDIPPDTNPSLLIDPNRQLGLRRDHPFTEALFSIPAKYLRELIKEDRDEDKKKQTKIANEATQNRLDKLAEAASKFISERLEEMEEISKRDEIDRTSFVKEGVLIYPTYFYVALNEIRTITYYVNASLLKNKKEIVSIEADDEALEILDKKIELQPHKKNKEQLCGRFRVKGKLKKDDVLIKAKCNNLPEAQAIAAIVEDRIEEHLFEDPFEFEHNSYSVKQSSRKALKIYAKFPDVISEETTIKVTSSDSEGIPIRGSCILKPILSSNYAYGEVVIEGRRLNAKADIIAILDSLEANTKAKVVQKPERKIPFEIKLVNKEMGNFRAQWAVSEGKPYLLEISALHDSIKRYLGAPPDFEGQNLPLFKILLSEIVAESVCRKSLILEAKERPWDFRWADDRDDNIIAERVVGSLQERLKEFTPVAHAIMLSNREFIKAKQNWENIK
jgi:hypothetical protein